MHSIEKDKQDTFTWERGRNYPTYNKILGYYQAMSCLENARGNSLLDLPCGDGTLTQIFCDHFKRVVGVDASHEHLQKARERLPGVEFHEALLEEVRLNQTFGTVVMLNVLEHVVDPIHALRCASAFVEDGGVLIVHVPNALAVNRQIAVMMGTLTSCEELSPFDIQIAGHRRSYTMKSLLADIKAADLSVTKTGGVFYKMLSTPQMDWFLAQGPWQEGGFGWGRVGAAPRDWRAEFCRACYEYGKVHPEECNIIYACIAKPVSDARV